MRRVLRLLKSFWLLSFALWLVGVLLCLWWIPRLGGEPQRLVIAVALLSALWLLAIVLRRYFKARAERELETLVQLEVDREAASAASQSGDYEVLRERLKSALGMLKARHGGNGTLTELPWYLVVGHSASGKTSLLTRSGLNASVAGLGAESGTQYCDWYFGSEAVMIDTAGRYIAEEQPAREFADFLRLLTKRRKRTPINGLIVVVDLPTLLSAPRDENHALAQQLIERIDTYHDALGATPPVYLCFSKADLVPGFVEAFGGLEGDKRHCPWGITFPVAEVRGKGLGQAFRQRFAPLVASLRAHVERRLVQEGSRADSALLRFPDYVAEMEQRLADFLEPFDLRHNPDSAPLARGLYFTSALQRGEGLQPILDDQVKDTFALTGEAPAEDRATHRGERSYFIQGLFRDVLIPDRNLVQHYSRHGRRQALKPWLIAMAGLAGLGGLGVLGHAYWHNHESLLALEQRLDTAEQARDGDRLDILRGELERFQGEVRNGAPFWENAGLGIGRRLLPGLEEAWFAALERQVLSPVAAGLADQLVAVGDLAASLGLETRLDTSPGAYAEDEPGPGDAFGRGSGLLSDTGERMQERLTSRPTLGSVPRSPGDLASRVRGEADYRLAGGVRDAYWGARGNARDALRQGARDAWSDSLRGSEEGGQAGLSAIEDGPAFSEAALNRLEPAQVAQLVEAYDALKLYLILTDPQAHPEVEFVREALPRAWRSAAGSQGHERQIRDHVALYAAYLEAGRAPAVERDEHLIAQARADLQAFLVETSPAAREYLRLRLAAEANYPALTLADILPESSRSLMYAGEAVPAFFTQRVWQEFVLPELLKTLASDLQVERDWVLEGESEVDEVQGKAQFAQEVLARYKLEYIFAWERFLADVGVRRFAGLDDSRQHLTQLSDYQRSPIKVLLQEVDANTRWDHPDASQRRAEENGGEADEEGEGRNWWQNAWEWLGGEAGQAGERALALVEMPTIHDGILANHFEPVGQLFSADIEAEGDTSRLDRYLLLLRQLKVRFDRLERGDVGKRTKQLMEDVVEGRPNEITALHNYVAANIDTSRDELVQSLQRLFRDPVEFAVTSLDSPIAGQLAAAWGDQVATPWNSMVGGRFPVSESSNEASVRDLRLFVDPQTGLLTDFERNEVGSLGEAFNGDGEPLVDPRITSTISQGTRVGRVLESLADIENGFEIMIEPSANLTSIRLMLDGQEQVYRMGPQSWQRFTWPGDTRQAGARLDVVTHGGQRVTVFDYPSRWGLLRLVDSAQVTDLDGVRQRLSWYTSVGPVSIVVRNFGGVKLTDLEQVRSLRIPTVEAH
ncbi:ImcF-like protein [Halomonas sp. MCCC 1A11036]|uniref:ImcF-like protein n=1 Tax=Billgrantia zhangzhouensis TaxID=2733481 RepID=A0ABS9AAB7_9GAMM|nr:type VI secretion protein IcmF/TssM N-terminal domain-containing protein [Halomonas zhangzhouensis]MCE8018507.1 ImcF-like protein [Halomonas zhangzhouensis]